ncbi:MAG: SDR family oxidoreductase [Pseudomonadota bacterium]
MTEISRRLALTGIATAGAAIAAAGAATAQTSPKPLAGKTAVVTGARRNQGRAYAVQLATMGANLVLHHHRADGADDTAETARLVAEAGSRSVTGKGDLGDPATAAMLFDAAEAEFGGADILIHTAGAIIKKPVAAFTDADFERLLNDNTRTTFYAMREGARRLRDGGRIVAVGTSLTAGTAPGYAVYAGTKAPVEEFTRMMARELGSRGITVNNVAPGPLDNSFFHAAETPQTATYAASLAPSGRLGNEADIVPVVANLASEAGAWTNGQTLFINGGYVTR